MKTQEKNSEGRPIVKHVTIKETAFEKHCQKEIEHLKQELATMRHKYLQEMELCQRYLELYKEKEAESHQLNMDLLDQTEQWLNIVSLSDSIECSLKVETKKRRRLEKHLRKSEEGRALLAQYKFAEIKRIPICVEAEANENNF